MIQTLLDKRDFVAAMGLLVQWLSESENLPLAEQDDSFYRLAEQWLTTLLASDGSQGGHATEPSAGTTVASASAGKPAISPEPLAAKFFDYLEANAGDYWEVPRPAWVTADDGRQRNSDDGGAGGSETDDEMAEKSPYEAAYEGVTYLDTTDDGIEGATLESGEPASDYELEFESVHCARGWHFCGCWPAHACSPLSTSRRRPLRLAARILPQRSC